MCEKKRETCGREEQAKLEPNTACYYNTGISVCEKSSASEMWEAELESDAIRYNDEISACREGRAVAMGYGAERETGGEPGAQRQQLQRGQQSVREGRHQLQRWEGGTGV